MKNLLDENVCLDQGPVPGNTPIMHYCHGFSSQVSSTVFLALPGQVCHGSDQFLGLDSVIGDGEAGAEILGKGETQTCTCN